MITFDEFVEQNQKAIKAVFSHYRRWFKHLSNEDLQHLIMLGTFEIFSYPEKYNKYNFRSYLQKHIFFYRHSKYGDFMQSKAIMSDHINEPYYFTPDDIDLDEIFQILTPVETDILMAYDIEEKGLQECAEQFNCSHETVRQIRLKAIQKIKSKLNN